MNRSKHTSDFTHQKTQSRTKEPAKRTAKDSVFTDLFQNPKYLLQLYQTLHPEDVSVTEADIHNVTIKNILLDQRYNDLGFCVDDRLVILTETQTGIPVLFRRVFRRSRLQP